MNGPAPHDQAGPFYPGDLSPRRYFFSIAIVLGVLFGLLGGSDDNPLSIVQWPLQAIIAITALVTLHMGLIRTFASRLPSIWQLVLSGTAASVLITPIFYFVDVLFGQNQLPESIPAMPLALLEEWAGIYPLLLLAWIAMNAPMLFGYRLRQQVTKPSQEAARAFAPRFLSLPDAPRGALQYLKAELHYLKVVTDQSNALLLYNLRDAIAELPEDEGVQCHRSYWVHLDAVAGYRKDGRQGVITTRTGEQIPVSRNYRVAVEEAVQERVAAS